jgi:hypothetical protein
MIHTTKEIQKGNTVYLECIFRDMNGVAVDPSTTPQYSILSESGSTITTGYLTKRKDGYYGTYYAPSAIGEYQIAYTGTVDGKVVVLKSNFKVITSPTNKS